MSVCGLLDFDGDYDEKCLNLIAILLSSFISFSGKSGIVTLDYHLVPLVHCLNYLENQVSYDKNWAHFMQHYLWCVCFFLGSQAFQYIWTLLWEGSRRERVKAWWWHFEVTDSWSAPSSDSCSGPSLLQSSLWRRPKAISDKFCSIKITHLIIAVKMVEA